MATVTHGITVPNARVTEALTFPGANKVEPVEIYRKAVGAIGDVEADIAGLGSKTCISNRAVFLGLGDILSRRRQEPDNIRKICIQ